MSCEIISFKNLNALREKMFLLWFKNVKSRHAHVVPTEPSDQTSTGVYVQDSVYRELSRIDWRPAHSVPYFWIDKMFETISFSVAIESFMSCSAESMETGGKRWICVQCGKGFNKKDHLKNHIEALHLQMQYPCTYPNCIKVCNSQPALRGHIRNWHI